MRTSSPDNPSPNFDRTGRNRLTIPGPVGIYLIQACGLTPSESSIPGIGLSGLVTPPSHTLPTISPLLFKDQNFGDFCRLGPRMDT